MSKVWELIRDSFNDTKYMTQEEIEIKMIDYKMTSCDAKRSLTKDSNYSNLRKFKKKMKCNEDCLNCLRKYLNMEVEEESK